jgi:integrase
VKVNPQREKTQRGTVKFFPRKKGPGQWKFLYRDYQPDGSYLQRKETFADENEIPRKKKKIAEDHPKVRALRDRINHNGSSLVYFKDLCRHYDANHIANLEGEKTRNTYRANMRYLEAQFADLRLSQMIFNAQQVQDWLDSKIISEKTGEPLANQTRRHIKAQLVNMFSTAQLAGAIVAHPFAALTVTKGEWLVKRNFHVEAEMFAFMVTDSETPEHVRMMIWFAACTTMRAEEILALQYDDFDFDRGRIKVQRAVVGKHIGRVKNPASRANTPLHPRLAAELIRFREIHPPIHYDAAPWAGDWVFGSDRTSRPFHLGMLINDHLRPALNRMAAAFSTEVPENVGFHAFRHTGNDIYRDGDVGRDVRQQLMRWGNSEMPDYYGSLTPRQVDRMKEANDRLVEHYTAALRTGTDGD